MGVTHDDRSQLSEQSSLQRLGKKISQHPFGGAVNNIKTIQLESVFYPEISDVDVSGVGSTGFPPIFLKLYGAFIVLMKRVLSHGISLVLEELFRPDRIREVVTGPD